MFIKDKCPISATPSGSDAMYHIFFYKCLMPLASGCKTVFLLNNSCYAECFLLKFQAAFFQFDCLFQTCLVEIQVFAKISSGEAKTV